MAIGACGIDCSACRLNILGVCSSCDAGSSLGGARKLAAQLASFGGFCPVLKCAHDRNISYCPRDCVLFPCDEFTESGYPFSRERLDARAQDARGIRIRPELALSKEVWERLESLDPHTVAEKSGVEWKGGVYLLELLGIGFNVDPGRRSLRRDRGVPPDLLDAKGVVYYLAHLPGGEIMGRPVAPNELNSRVNFFKGRYALMTGLVEDVFGDNPGGFVRAGERLGGVTTHKGDGSFRIKLLPRVPVELIFWARDESFPPRLTLTLDRSAENHLPLDLLADLLNLLLQRVAAWAG